MKKILLIAVMVALAFPVFAHADEVLPALSKEDMSSYKNAFGQAIAESKRAQEKPRGEPVDNAQRKENFGNEVSKAAKEMKQDILKDNSNFGGWVSKQRRSDKAEEKSNRGNENSTEMRNSSPGGRPAGAGRPDSAGKSNHDEHPNKGNGNGNGKGQ